MADPVKLSVTILDGDTEIATMNMLHQVIEHMNNYESLTYLQRHRIADWFASRYGEKEPT